MIVLMKSPLRTLSISVLGLAVAGLIGVTTAGSASAHESKAPTTVSVSAASATSVGIQLKGPGNRADCWTWGG